MKQVYVYSQKQFDAQMSNQFFPYYNSKFSRYKDNIQFTQQQSFEDDEEIDFRKINNYDDNIVVHISENLLLNELSLKRLKKRFANTSKEGIKIIKS